MKTDNHTNQADTLQADIIETRTRMDGKLDAVSKKLSPSKLASEAGDWTREKIDNIDLEGAKEKAKDNTLPLAFLGMAVGSFFLGKWYKNRQSGTDSVKADNYSGRTSAPASHSMAPVDQWASRHEMSVEESNSSGSNGHNLTNRVKEHTSAIGESIGEKARSGQEKISNFSSKAAKATSEKAQTVRESVRNTASSSAQAVKETTSNVSAKVNDFTSNAWEGSREASMKTQQKIKEQHTETPLLFGAGALAVGFLTALLLPRTKTEDEYCGASSEEYKNKFRQKKEEMVSDAKQKLHEARLDTEGLEERAEEGIDEAYETASSKIDKTSEQSS